MKNIVAVVIGLLFSQTLLASGYNGPIRFSAEEKERHRSRINQFNQLGEQCLWDFKEKQIDFFNNHCVRLSNGKKRCLTKFYGERKFSKKHGALRPEDGKPLIYLGDEMRRLGFPLSWMKDMEKTSCVGMALECLKRSFEGTGQGDIWQKVRRFTVVKNNSGGTALQFALQKLGWRVLYWNPAPYSTMDEDMKRWDDQEAGWKSKGYHAWRWYTINTYGTYYYNPVDDYTTLVGFDRSIPPFIKTVPFWIGIANTGYHVFPGTEENVVEAHSTREIDSRDNLEFSFFSPLVYGGGPRWTDIEKYRTGLIAVPPGY